MPQELALYTEFTIQETCQYFGRIYKMSSREIKTQMEFLTSLLDLPPSHRTIGTLRYLYQYKNIPTIMNIMQRRTAKESLFRYFLDS